MKTRNSLNSEQPQQLSLSQTKQIYIYLMSVGNVSSDSSTTVTTTTIAP